MVSFSLIDDLKTHMWGYYMPLWINSEVGKMRLGDSFWVRHWVHSEHKGRAMAVEDPAKNVTTNLCPEGRHPQLL